MSYFPVWIQFIISGVLLGVGLVVPLLWWVTIVGVAMFLAAASQTPRLRAACFGGWLAFSVKTAIAIGWFWSVYPFDWLLAAPPAAQLGIIGAYWCITSVVIGLGGVLAGGAVYCLWQRRYPLVLCVVLCAVAWVVAEILGSLVFSLYILGPGGTLNIAFSFGYSGYVLAEQGLLLMGARLGGVYMLSFVAALLGGTLWILCQRRQPLRVRIAGMGVLGVVLGLSAVPAAPVPTLPADTTVAALQTTFVSDELNQRAGREEQAEVIEDALAAAAAAEADYLLLPEDARFVQQFPTPQLALQWLRDTYPESNLIVIDSARTEGSSGRALLRSYTLDPTTSEVYSFDKQYLVPQGEYVPYFYGALIRAFGGAGVFQHISDRINYQTGPLAGQMLAPTHIPPVLFCFDSVNPLSALSLTTDRERVPFIAHPVSHSWFTDARTLGPQLRAMLAVHQEWRQVPVIIAANQATVGFLSNNTDSGEIIWRSVDGRHELQLFK